ARACRYCRVRNSAFPEHVRVLGPASTSLRSPVLFRPTLAKCAASAIRRPKDLRAAPKPGRPLLPPVRCRPRSREVQAVSSAPPGTARVLLSRQDRQRLWWRFPFREGAKRVSSDLRAPADSAARIAGRSGTFRSRLGGRASQAGIGRRGSGFGDRGLRILPLAYFPLLRIFHMAEAQICRKQERNVNRFAVHRGSDAAAVVGGVGKIVLVRRTCEPGV